jgi:hypothetical protein
MISILNSAPCPNPNPNPNSKKQIEEPLKKRIMKAMTEC